MTKIWVSVEKLRKFCTRSITPLYSELRKYMPEIQKSRTKQRRHDGSLGASPCGARTLFSAGAPFILFFLNFAIIIQLEYRDN